jgi:aspartyl-tRNA(Asn)/glutamyl-tRNA(Gln) amidotransferase subunit C
MNASDSPTLTKNDITRIAKLASLPVSEQQAEELTEQVGVTVSYVSQLQSLATDEIEETSQVTGMENVLREDEVDTSRMFRQEEALANAKRTYNGFFVVDRVLEEK